MSRSEHHSTLASITWHEAVGVRYVVATGELDLSNSGAFEAALDAERLHIDLTGVTFFDSTALRTLLQARIDSPDFHLELSRTVRKVLEIAGVLEMMGVGVEDEPAGV